MDRSSHYSKMLKFIINAQFCLEISRMRVCENMYTKKDDFQMIPVPVNIYLTVLTISIWWHYFSNNQLSIVWPYFNRYTFLGIQFFLCGYSNTNRFFFSCIRCPWPCLGWKKKRCKNDIWWEKLETFWNSLIISYIKKYVHTKLLNLMYPNKETC